MASYFGKSNSGGIVSGGGAKKANPWDKFGFQQQLATKPAYSAPQVQPQAPTPPPAGYQPHPESEAATGTPQPISNLPTPTAQPKPTATAPVATQQATAPINPKPNPAQPTGVVSSAPAGNRPNSGGMAKNLWQTAMGAMQNPSRYDAGLVKQGAKVIEDTIARMRQSGMRNLGEHHASRGLLGSSLESTDVTNLEGQLDERARQMLFDLQREQANTFGADRQSAFGMGLGTAGLSEGITARMGNEDYRDRALAQDRYFGDRSNDRADLGLAGDFAGRFGPEVVERLGLPAGASATAPAVSPIAGIMEGGGGLGGILGRANEAALTNPDIWTASQGRPNPYADAPTPQYFGGGEYGVGRYDEDFDEDEFARNRYFGEV